MAAQSPGIVRTIDQEVGDWRMVAGVFSVEPSAIFKSALMSLSQEWVERLALADAEVNAAH